MEVDEQKPVVESSPAAAAPPPLVSFYKGTLT